MIDPQEPVSHTIDKIGATMTAVLASDTFVHVLSDYVALIGGILTIVWFAIRIYDRLKYKNIEK